MCFFSRVVLHNVACVFNLFHFVFVQTFLQKVPQKCQKSITDPSSLSWPVRSHLILRRSSVESRRPTARNGCRRSSVWKTDTNVKRSGVSSWTTCSECSRMQNRAVDVQTPPVLVQTPPERQLHPEPAGRQFRKLLLWNINQAGMFSCSAEVRAFACWWKQIATKCSGKYRRRRSFIYRADFIKPELLVSLEESQEGKLFHQNRIRAVRNISDRLEFLTENGICDGN